MGHMLHQIIQAMHTDFTALLVNAVVRRRADSNVVSMHSVVVEELLDRYAHGYATAPHSNNKGRTKVRIQDLRAKMKSIFEQTLCTEVLFISHKTVSV